MSETTVNTPDRLPTFEEASALVCAPGTLLEIVDGEIDGRPTKLFAATPPNIRALYDLAALRTDEFIIYEDERWTMSDVLALAGQLGHALVESYGVTKGDRVAIAMRNCPQWVASFVAVTSIGAIAVPLNAWWTGEEMAFAINDCQATVVLGDHTRMERLTDEEMTDPHPTLVLTHAEVDSGKAAGVLPDGVVMLADSLVEGAAMPDADIGPDDDVTILYTSGTTGHPKGAVSTHRAVLSALLSFAARKAVSDLMDPPSTADEAESGHEPESGDGSDEAESGDAADPPGIFMLPVPLFHVTGLVPILLGSFVSGARLVMTYRWDPERALELIEREKVTHFIGVPTMSWDLLESPGFAERDVSSLLGIGGGGAPMPPELVKRIGEAFPNGYPQLGYGMTETNAYGPSISGREFLTHPRSTGRALPTMKLRITDSDGNELGPGEVGEIWFSGPNLIRGYWNRPEATAETIVDGWLRSGDIGYIDEEGFVYVSDRAKDMVLRAGENVYCAEVEAVIYQHPAIYEAAVFGVPHERLGEEVAAVIMPKPGSTFSVDELTAFLGEHLAPFKVPSKIGIVTEQLPRNASGKILKRELRDRLTP